VLSASKFVRDALIPLSRKRNVKLSWHHRYCKDFLSKRVI
jgi:hypothetical protein